MRPTAIIIGAGIAGLSAAIALQQAGWDISLYEQAPALKPMGAALSLWPNAMAALDRLGCADAIRAGAQRLDQLALVQQDGRDIMRMAVSQVLPGAQAFMPTRTMLQQSLLDRLNMAYLKLGHRLISFDADADRVSVSFDNGKKADGDLLVAADGIWSTIALDVLGVAASHAGYGGVLALSDAVPRQSTLGIGTEYWGQGERIGLFDIAGGGAYWFYMRNEDDPARSREIDRNLVAARVSGWPPSLAPAIAATPPDRLMPFSIHAKPPPKTLGKGRVICVGDAAHAMEPNMGQGGCQALEDAVALGAAAMGRDAMVVLPEFERMRLKRVRQFVRMSRGGALVPHRLPPMLSSVSLSLMRIGFKAFAAHSMRSLYQMPDYA